MPKADDTDGRKGRSRSASGAWGEDDLGRATAFQLQHRVRNILAVVRSLAARTVETSDSLEDFAVNFDGRLAALARTQNMLWRHPDAVVDLAEMARDELLAVGVHDGEQAEVTGPVVYLRQSAAEVMALALHELTVNALKFGALGRPDGRLAVNWTVRSADGGARLELLWREISPRPIDLSPARRGFGRRMIEEALPYEIDAESRMEFLPGGVQVSITVPLTEAVALPQPASARRRARPPNRERAKG